MVADTLLSVAAEKLETAIAIASDAGVSAKYGKKVLRRLRAGLDESAGHAPPPKPRTPQPTPSQRLLPGPILRKPNRNRMRRAQQLNIFERVAYGTSGGNTGFAGEWRQDVESGDDAVEEPAPIASASIQLPVEGGPQLR